MKRVRARICELTPRGRCHQDVRSIIKTLNPVLQGWSGYFRSGNAADCVRRRLKKLLVARKGRNLKPGEVKKWNRVFFKSHGLIQLNGRIQYPEAA